MTISSVRNSEDTLTILPAQDGAMLMSLPYRIGLYVSYSDVTGGWEAQEAELQSLANILRQYSEDFCKSAFCQKLLMETLMKRSEWPSWSQNIESVPDQAGRAVDLLAAHLSEKELRGFKEVLADIAVSVAMAFHEEKQDGDGPESSSNQGLISILLSKMKGGGESSSSMDHLHISRSERVALARVCDAMKHKLQG